MWWMFQMVLFWFGNIRKSVLRKKSIDSQFQRVNHTEGLNKCNDEYNTRRCPNSATRPEITILKHEVSERASYAPRRLEHELLDHESMHVFRIIKVSSGSCWFWVNFTSQQ